MKLATMLLALHVALLLTLAGPESPFKCSPAYAGPATASQDDPTRMVGADIDTVRVIVRLRDTPEEPVISHLDRLGAGQRYTSRSQSQSRRSDIFKILQRRASEGQNRILSRLEGLRTENNDHPRSVRSLWVANSFAVCVRPDEIPRLLADAAVAEVAPNAVLSIPDALSEPAGDSGSPLNLWNHDIINLDWVRALGIDGTGVRIGHIDTGIDAGHPEVAGKIVAWQEFDAAGEPVASAPHETHYMGHGTHVASVMVGDVAGMAPGARLLSALALPEGRGTIEQVLAAVQWVVDPDDDFETDDGAQIVNMSWGLSGRPGVLQAAIDNLQASGILPVAAIGNNGTGDTFAPGNTPGAVGVGATTAYDSIAVFSAGGEVCWNRLCFLKPDLSAPGVHIYGADSTTGGFQLLSGTSAAAPHVSGAAALLTQYHPALTLPQLIGFLGNSSHDLGPYGMDDRFGWGRLDMRSAIEYIEAYAPRLNRSDLIVETTKAVAGQSITVVYVHFAGTGDRFLNDEFDYVPIWPAPGSQAVEVLGSGDVDGDGFTDLIVADTVRQDDDSHTIRYDVYPTRGDHGFYRFGETWGAIDTSDPGQYRLIGVADVNGDSQSDLLIAHEKPRGGGQDVHLLVLLSTGTGFEVSNDAEWATIFATSDYRFDFGIGDVNGDGRSDLVYTKTYKSFMRYYPTQCYVMLSDGSGFQPQVRWLTIQPAYPYSPIEQFYYSDVNGDGFADITFSDQVSNYAGDVLRLHVCLSNGASRFKSSTKWAEIDAGHMPLLGTLSDVDGDGAADLVVTYIDAELNADTIHVWRAEAQTKRFVPASQAWFAPPSNFFSNGFDLVDAANVGMGTWGAWSW